MRSGDVLTAFRQALRLTAGAARYALAAYALNLCLTLLLAGLMFDALQGSLGSSLAGERMRAGWDPQWYDGFSPQAQGVAGTFRPSVTGAGAVLDALDAFADGFSAVRARGPGTGVLVAMAVYLLSWSFLGAGFVGTFAASPGGAGFLQRAARWFPRLLPLTVVGLVFYGVLLGPVRGWLDLTVDERLHEVIDERARFAWTALAYLCLWTAVVLVNLVIDYAKVLVVLRGETAILAGAGRALPGAVRLVARHPVRTLGLYATTAVLGLTGVLAYVAVAPGAAGGSWLGIAGAFLLGQLFVLSRVLLRCLFFAGEVVMARQLGAAESAAVVGVVTPASAA
jgi:hypothetical protein